jgi:hypothetical protein
MAKVKKQSTIDRFNTKYILDPETNCWLWTDKIHPSGYGRIGVEVGDKNKMIYAHRFSYENFVGPLNPKLEICHTCNCKSCVNPSHLRQDTHSSNQIDRVYDGNNSYQKLTPEQVIEIKIALLNPFYGLITQLAKKYNVNNVTIHDIKTGRNWSHLKIE